MTGLPPLSQAARAKLAELANRQVTADDWRTLAEIPRTPEEIEHTLARVQWFRRRYPTVAERLAYVRRAHARWKRATLPPNQPGR